VARGQEVSLHLETERLAHWKGVGAQLSDRVQFLVRSMAKNADASKAAAKEEKAA
jgi:small subunit ribosomal protein S16